MTDVQKVLGHSADIIVAANARDTGISVLATKSPQKTIVVSATKKSISPKTIIVEDNSPQRKSLLNFFLFIIIFNSCHPSICRNNESCR